MSAQPVRGRQRFVEIVFDLRGTIAVLFTIYGMVCIIWGLAFTDASERARSGGINLNLWAGIGMLVFAVLMWIWAASRPEEPAEKPAPDA